MTEKLTPAHPFENRPGIELSEEGLRELGRACVAITIDDLALEEYASLLENPNSFGENSIFPQGEIPTEDDKVYRQVDIGAIEDLATTGIVRNGATAAGSSSPRWGHRVFWTSGKEGTAVNTGGRAVIVASKEAAGKGWVTIPDIHAIHVKTPDGRLVNLLDGTSRESQ